MAPSVRFDAPYATRCDLDRFDDAVVALTGGSRRRRLVCCAHPDLVRDLVAQGHLPVPAVCALGADAWALYTELRNQGRLPSECASVVRATFA